MDFTTDIFSSYRFKNKTQTTQLSLYAQSTGSDLPYIKEIFFQYYFEPSREPKQYFCLQIKIIHNYLYFYIKYRKMPRLLLDYLFYFCLLKIFTSLENT